MSANSENRFGADFIVTRMLLSIPRAAQPQLRDPWDAVALFCHASMLAAGFRLLGLGEDERLESAISSDKIAPLPIEWNNTTTSNYAFRYAHSQSAMQFVIKISRLGGKAIIHGIGIGDDKVAGFDIPVRDFVSASSLPFTLSESAASDEAIAEDQSAKASLQGVFISTGRMGDLSALMKISIFQKLIPALQKEGYEETTHSPQRSNEPVRPGATGSDRPQNNGSRPHDPEPARPHPFDDPLSAGPRQNPRPVPDFVPPDFEDEHGILRPPGRGGLGGHNPLAIGERDLYPAGLGPNDPLRVGGIGPAGLGPRGGGGMHPTFDDPLFAGPGGQGGYDPSAPPGARYDPVGPGDAPRDLRGGARFPRGGPGGGFGGGASNPFGGYGSNDFI